MAWGRRPTFFSEPLNCINSHSIRNVPKYITLTNLYEFKHHWDFFWLKIRFRLKRPTSFISSFTNISFMGSFFCGIVSHKRDWQAPSGLLPTQKLGESKAVANWDGRTYWSQMLQAMLTCLLYCVMGHGELRKLKEVLQKNKSLKVALGQSKITTS